MRSVAVSIVLAVFLLLGVLVVVLLKTSGSPAGAPAGPRSSAVSDSRLAELEGHVAAIQERLIRLEEGLRSVSSREPGPRDTIGPRRSPAGGTAEGPEGEPVAAEEGSVAAPGEIPALASLTEGEAEGLRTFVAQVIEDDRLDRQKRQQEEAQRRMEEWKEFQKGPYGKHNYKVNSLAKQLELTDPQKQHYYNLLVDYESRFQELRKEVDWKSQEAREEYEESRKGLQKEFDTAVIWGLGPGQREAYEEFPDWQRRVEGGGFFYTTTGVAGDAQVATFNVGGTAGMVNVVVDRSESETKAAAAGKAEDANADAPSPKGETPSAPQARVDGR